MVGRTAFLNDLKVLARIALAPGRGDSHRERLESFYSSQAKHYDDFRQRLLHGREELMRRMPIVPNGVWIDIGGGTGNNLEAVGAGIGRLREVCIVDLSPSLLSVARERIRRNGWNNVRAVEADATQFQLERDQADVVTCSYSLTMIPDWHAAIDNAWRMLKPGGCIGVVDFYVSRKHPPPERKRHSAFTRLFWPAWFSRDNVFPSSDHLPYLQRRFETVSVQERSGRVPYMPGLRAPYYQFVGKKSADAHPIPEDSC